MEAARADCIAAQSRSFLGAKRIFLLVISALSKQIAGGFAHLGAWLILLFAGLGMLLLAWLLWYVYPVHSRQEVVHFSDSEVLVDKWPQ